MHKAWAQQVASSGSKEGPRVSMGDVELGFKEMLLQSRALEYTLEVIASEPSLRQNYMEPLSSPVACLYELLSKTLAFPVAQWAEILKVAMSGTLPGDQQTDFLLAAVSALKCDWHEEVLFNQRKDLALRAEYLRQEIRQVEGSQSDAQLSRRMAPELQSCSWCCCCRVALVVVVVVVLVIAIVVVVVVVVLLLLFLKKKKAKLIGFL
ncbi:unnamed protein product [Polarella glacialis]|uniref:Uncharacterized protein n=1 Tax=Polarella glacialis TaxID=89957 RepID=A0A813GM37_POLGL|nr:unnamed protein product [Polarella glacialis]